MNFGIDQIETTTNNSNTTIATLPLATSISTTTASDNTRKDSTNILTETEIQSSSVSSFNSTKLFTTPQNCLEILTSIQNYTIPTDCEPASSLSSSESNAKIQPLEEEFTGDQSMKLILPDELTKQNNLSISESCSNIETTIKSTSSSLSNSLSETASSLKIDNLPIETDLNLSRKSLNIQTVQTSSCKVDYNTEFHDTTDINDLNITDSRLSIDSANILRCDQDTVSKSSENSGDVIRSDCIDKIKNVSRLSERAKKKSWYNVLYPNYKSRSQDFKKLFKEVPNDERLIVDYSCAFYRDLLIQGRLYISQNYVGFHANILGWETCFIIEWKDVTAITKEKTALVIPNAISICTPKENFFFSSFTARDKTFLILFRVWQNTLMNKPMPAQEIWQLVHNYYGDELGLTTDDEDYIDPTVEDREDNVSNLDFVSAVDDTNSLGVFEEAIDLYNTNIYETVENSSGYSASDNSSGNKSESIGECVNLETMKANAKELTLISAKPEEGLSSGSQTQQTSAAIVGSASSTAVNSSANAPPKETKHNTTTIDSKRKVSKINRQREENTNKNSETLPTDISDSTDSEENNIPFVATAECNSPHEGRQLVHTILPINIETLFNLLFSKSKFLLDFHAMRKSTDLLFSEWTTNEDGQRTRTFNVTVQLAASVGPKTSKVTEYQLMRDCSKPGELYSIDVNNVNAGIPYADSFSVLVHYCLVKTVDDHTMLSVHAQIKYKKSIWGVVKGFIEKNTWAGLDDFYTSLLHSLQSETCIPPAKGKGRRPRRGITAQIRPPEDIPILQTKPEPAELCSIAQTISTRHATESPVIIAESSIKFRWLSLFVLVLLCFLIIVNVILLLKLWKLEERIEGDMSARARMPNLSALNQLPNNHEEWIELLRQQEILHETELKKWHTVLQTAIELLKKTERTLAELMFR